MLFNTLANVRSLVREDVDRAESMIDQLIVYLRSALAASQTESVALSREFAQLRAYLDIMALRMGPRLSYRLELPAALERTEVPPMLLQPLVENAIKHGLEPKVGSGSIEVVVLARRPRASRSASTTAASACRRTREEAAARPAGTSYGLQHVRDRLQAVYGAAARLSLERRQPTGVSAVVFIPA
jgi:LytS/YehU family sensor histidine kinase